MLRMMYDDVVLLTLTDWGLLVRKSKIQLQSDGARPSAASVFTSVCGMIQCRTKVQEEQPHVGVLVLQVCEGLVDHSSDGVSCGAVPPVGILVMVSCYVDGLFYVRHNQPLKALHCYWCSDRAVVIRDFNFMSHLFSFLIQTL